MFGNKKDTKTLSFGFGGYKFSADTRFLSYQSAYGKSFRVLIKDIEGVSLGSGRAGRNNIQLNGKGVILAEVELPKTWAEQAQDFIYEILRDEK